MSLSFDLRIAIKFYGDEALAWAVQAAVDAVLLHEYVYNEVGAFYHVADDGMLVVCAETGYSTLLLNGWDKWHPWFEAQIRSSVAELVLDPCISIEWDCSDEDEDPETPDLVEETTRSIGTRPVPAAPVDWPDLADRLARVLNEMPTDAFLIIGTTGDRYAQFARQPGEIYCEVASNRTLDPQHHLSPEQESDMTAHGWSAPPGNGTEDWAKLLRSPIGPHHCADLAAEVVRALSTALAVSAPGELKVEAWRDGLAQTFAVDGLGLNRLPTPWGARRLIDERRRQQSEVSGLTRRVLRWARIG